MPIRSPRGRTAAYRALWQWPLRSPVRLAVVVFVVFAVGFGISSAVGAFSGPGSTAGPEQSADGSDVTEPGRSSNTPPDSRGSRGPVPTALPPVPDLTPTTIPTSRAPAAALEVAARWSAAWLRPPAGTTTEAWVEGLSPSTTEEYLGVLSAVDPANIPATRVTGEPRAVSVAANSVEVEVPTDALTLLVLVVLTDDGWRVSGYDRA